MTFRKRQHLFTIVILTLAFGLFSISSYAQVSVSITGLPSASSTPAPSGSFNITASASTSEPSQSITKVVFYRNDVPYITDTTASPNFQISQGNLGQENYVYRARAYSSSGKWADSNELKLTVETPRVFRMGESVPVPSPSPYGATSGPDRTYDHTDDIRAALAYLAGLGGGTLLFPCEVPSGDDIAIYNVSDTISVPENITIQGEGAEEKGRCRIYWIDLSDTAGGCHDNSGSLTDKPMFNVIGGISRVRFRDLWLYSRSSGHGCYPRYDYERIAVENTVAIQLNTDDRDGEGDITDIIFENISISNFTHGISGISSPSFLQDHEISNIKIRGYRPDSNHRQLFIDARYAYNWDVQNLNSTAMLAGQGGVEIKNAGAPSVTDGENKKLKFLQLNCNGARTTPISTCVEVDQHAGLYFRQLHHEGADKAIIVKSTAGANSEPIVMESGIGSGEYEKARTIYLIGNGILAPDAIGNGLDDARMRFKNDGTDSTLVNCGDVHTDWTDVQDDGNPSDVTVWEDLKMLFGHAERNRGSFYAEDGGFSFLQPRVYCPKGLPTEDGIEDIDKMGGEFFDNGFLPSETHEGLYTHKVDSETCGRMDVADCTEYLLTLGGNV